MRETMDELEHTNVSVAVNSYQRVVREHHRDTVELLAYRYLPSDPKAIHTVIAQEERQIGKPRDEVERLRRILLERDTGIPTDPDTVLPKNRNIEKPKPVKTSIKRNNPACPRPIGYRHTKNRRDGNNETGKYRKTGTSGPDMTRSPHFMESVYPKYKLRSNGSYDARDLHDLFRRSHLPSRDSRGSSAMFRRTRPADPFCCGWSGSAPVSGAAPRSDR